MLVKCPFCASKVDERAVVCAACRRDFSISKSLMVEKEELDLKFEALQAENRQLKALLTARERSFNIFDRPISAMSGVIGYIFFPIAVAVVLHLALEVMFDAEFALRIAVILLAILCGHTLQAQRRPTWFVTVSFAVLVAVGAVLAMSADTYFITNQHPEIIPTSAAERRNDAEYMASIALAYIFGAIVALYFRPLELPSAGHSGERFDETFARILSHNLPFWSAMPSEQRTMRYRSIVRACLSIATFLGMLWAGFSKFLSHSPS
jgi:hypothetical protein